MLIYRLVDEHGLVLEMNSNSKLLEELKQLSKYHFVLPQGLTNK